jgi:hypothetical protein
MQLSDAFLSLGANEFPALVRGISIGKLKTYQMYETLKTRSHLPRLNTEGLRKGAPRFWQRLQQRDEDFAKDLAQAVLVSHLDMVGDILAFLGIPNQDGFFEKDLDASKYLTEGWQQRAYERFRDQYPRPVLRLYINHLAWELQKDAQPFVPAE